VLRSFMHLTCLCGLLGFARMSHAADITHEKIKGAGLIAIEGDISSGDLEKFRQISVKYTKAVVALDSNGGALLPAIGIGKIIKIAGFATVVPEGATCASSCALIWLAGEARYLSPEGRVGFHASYRNNDGKLEESGVANALIGNYLTKLNLPEKAIIFATTAPPDKIMWLNAANKITAGIDFEEFGPQKLESSTTKNIQTTVVPSPAPTEPQQLISVLPPGFPASLYRPDYNWIRFSANGYLDSRSILQVRDAYGKLAGRKFWAVIDYSYDKTSKYRFSMVQYFVYCPDETVSIYSWTDYMRDGPAKSRNVFGSDSRLSPPGSVERELVTRVCD
jgi:hypothetical protein